MAQTTKLFINDFNIEVATANGTGSQSSNSILMRSIFNMGVPVSGKNIFPSNIQGLPTWFTIRVNKDGYLARRNDADLMVLMNPQTAHEDIRKLKPGKAVIYNASIKVDEKARGDLHYYACPFDDLVKEVCDNAKLMKLVVNMIYVGVAAHLLGIEWSAIEDAVKNQFSGKLKAVDLNVSAIRRGMDYAKENFSDRMPPYRLERMDKTKGKIIIDGNAAAALGCVFGGCTVFAWYPITPASSLGESFIHYAGKFRHDKDGKATYAIVQAEDEIAAAGMVIGAGWGGARSATSTSGPGISLMSEFVGLAYYAEVPGVFFDVQRVGPSTGLPTRTMQGDILTTSILSHGDTEHILLLPASVEECFAMAQEAFNLAEDFQTPVFFMSDLDLGMNTWMADPFPYPDKPFRRGKVLTAEDLKNGKDFKRYADVDGDGIPYRTLPGTEHPKASYFTRGSGHDEGAGYTESSETYQRILDRLKKKMRTAAEKVPQPVMEREGKKGEPGILAFGSTHFAMRECLDQIKAAGREPAYLRLRALPLNGKVRKFIEERGRVYVVEQNRDGQLTQILRAAHPDLAASIVPILHYDGMPVDAAFITENFLKLEKEKR